MRFTKVTIFVTLATLIGCGSWAFPPTTIGLYSDIAGPQSIKESVDQAVVERIYPYTASQVMDTAENTLVRMGYNIEEKDVKKGRITGSFPRVSKTVAIYVEQINPKPSTKLTLLVDTYNPWRTLGGGDTYAQRIVREIQRVLITHKSDQPEQTELPKTDPL